MRIEPFEELAIADREGGDRLIDDLASLIGQLDDQTTAIVGVVRLDAVDKWGEIAIPAGTEILSVRTHKRDGSTREPEEIAGKETNTAADVAIGDIIKW